MILVMVAVVAGPSHGGGDMSFMMFVAVTAVVSLVKEDYF